MLKESICQTSPHHTFPLYSIYSYIITKNFHVLLTHETDQFIGKHGYHGYHGYHSKVTSNGTLALAGIKFSDLVRTIIHCKAGSSSTAGTVLAVPSFGLLKINK